MTISIQPLDSLGRPTDKAFTSGWDSFVRANDGFDPSELERMKAVLTMGSGYLLGGGAAGAYRLKRVSN